MKWFPLQMVLKHASTTQLDFNVQLQIEAIIAKMGQSWPSQHVKGHQNGPVLSWEAKLNNIANTPATETHVEITPTMAQKIQFHYPAANIHLTLNGNTITRMVKRKIQEAYTSQLIKNNMEERFQWNTQVCGNIDWVIHGANLL
eukprot:3746197-Ditylum_brightwellii.AAC.1